jgi:hypothetical protein
VLEDIAMALRCGHILSFPIFVIPFLGLSPAVADEEKEQALFLQLREERKMRDEAESRIRGAEEARKRTELQLDELRASFAELFLENQRLRRDNESLRLQAGQLVVNEKSVGSAEVEELDRRLQQLQRNRRQVEQQLRELEVQLQTLMELGDGSDALRKLVNNRFAGVYDTLDQMAKTADGPPAGNAAPVREAAVLEVHADLQLVILDKGAEHGIDAGSRWQIKGQRDRPLSVQVVSVRQRICAATMLSGNVAEAGPGMTAQRQFSKPKKPKP